MDAPCKIQGSIHVFRLVNNMCPGKWVHIKAALQHSITTAPGFPVAHEGYRLVLLPLSPDTIHRPPLHRPENCHDPILQYKYYTLCNKRSPAS